MLNENFAIVGGLLILVCGFGYIWDTIKGKIQPNRVSWLFWGLAPTVAFLAQVSQGVGLQSFLTLALGLNSFLVFGFSFFNKKAYWKLEKFDFLCGALSFIGIFLWYITQVGNIAILFSILADGTASLPTLVKAYKDPSSESDILFWANSVSAVLTILTIKVVNFETAAFPLYILVMMGLIAVFIRFKIKILICKFF